MVFAESADFPLVQMCAYDGEDNPIWFVENAKGIMETGILRGQFLYREGMFNVHGMWCKSCVETACGLEI